MKLKIFLIIALAFILGSCSSQTYLYKGYDELYYEPGYSSYEIIEENYVANNTYEENATQIYVKNYYYNEPFYWSDRINRFHCDFYWNNYHRHYNRYYHLGYYSSYSWRIHHYFPYSYWNYNYHRRYYYPHTYWGHLGYYGYHTPINTRNNITNYIGQRRGYGSYTNNSSNTINNYGRRTSDVRPPETRRTDNTNSQSGTPTYRTPRTQTRTPVYNEGVTRTETRRPLTTTRKPEDIPETRTTTRRPLTTKRPAEDSETRPAARPASRGETTRPAPRTTTRPVTRPAPSSRPAVNSPAPRSSTPTRSAPSSGSGGSRRNTGGRR